MEFGGVFRALRQRAGFSQEEFAEKLHISQSDISKYENDVKTPDLPMFLQIIQVTQAPEVAVAFMLGMDGISIMQNLASLTTTLMGGFITLI
ncbi:helix-turn-helix domain-containing protein [Bacillus sp. FSL K6-3431]|uniref:helix-turn-helix domain-containing protein n=1 Tax=Bacillus sp. FSL K6-3431 TaxID=2921500 RepID=UPI0030F6FF23